jgi:hypothetical protein
MAMAACGSPSGRTIEVRADAVTPTTTGCSAASSCAPGIATDVDLPSPPAGMTAVAGEQTEKLDDTHTVLRRIWESPTPTFLNPGGQPMGGWLELELTTHPAADSSLADAMGANPRSFSGTAIGPRNAFVSNWTVTAQALDGATPVPVAATSIYMDISPTLRLQINTLGLSPGQAAMAALGAMIR